MQVTRILPEELSVRCWVRAAGLRLSSRWSIPSEDPIWLRSARREWQQHEFDRVNERPVEFSFALRALRDYPVVTVLDVGSGVSPFTATLAHCGLGHGPR